MLNSIEGVQHLKTDMRVLGPLPIPRPWRDSDSDSKKTELFRFFQICQTVSSRGEGSDGFRPWTLDEQVFYCFKIRLATYWAGRVLNNPTVEEISTSRESILADGPEENADSGGDLHQPYLAPELLIRPDQ